MDFSILKLFFILMGVEDITVQEWTMLSDINLYGSAVDNVRNRHSTLQVQV